mmetsp:Transcript_23166/g.49568  ORF Transcript_23166/g.49568 Transcript_23166/m.49568 type:complete len:216 (-) Transcript_23166:265-912(-)
MSFVADSGFNIKPFPFSAIFIHLALSAAPFSFSLSCFAIPSSLFFRTDASSNGGSIPAMGAAPAAAPTPAPPAPVTWLNPQPLRSFAFSALSVALTRSRCSCSFDSRSANAARSFDSISSFLAAVAAFPSLLLLPKSISILLVFGLRLHPAGVDAYVSTMLRRLAFSRRWSFTSAERTFDFFPACLLPSPPFSAALLAFAEALACFRYDTGNKES